MELRELLERDGTLVYKNRGDSMWPLIREGRDLVVIARLHTRPGKYDVPLYRRDTGDYVLHRILRADADGYVLCGDNCRKKEYGITDRHMVGVLTAVIRNGKRISTDSLGYRVYTHLWCGLYPVRACLLLGRDLYRRLRRRRKYAGIQSGRS